jgi:hypothetical protein
VYYNIVEKNKWKKYPITYWSLVAHLLFLLSVPGMSGGVFNLFKERLRTARILNFYRL